MQKNSAETRIWARLNLNLTWAFDTPRFFLRWS